MSDAQRKVPISNEKSPAHDGGGAPDQAPNQSGLRSPSLDGAASTLPGEMLGDRVFEGAPVHVSVEQSIASTVPEGSGLHRISSPNRPTREPSPEGAEPDPRAENRPSNTLINAGDSGEKPPEEARQTSGHASTMPASDDERHNRWDLSQLPVIDPALYSIGGEIARGGIGRIMRARDSRLRRPVALKELLETHGSASERFVREALLTSRLQHPSIVPVYEAGQYPTGEPFFAMKLVSGTSFDQVIAKARTLDERMALLPHVLNVCDAMAYAHSERIIHRDLKPQNILIGAFGETVVVDWGLAKDLSEETQAPPKNGKHLAASARHLTLAGSVMGTPAYMPPEQAAGRPVDERADVYSLGAILYHVLSGVAPYDGPTSVQILAQVASGPPVLLRELETDLPDDLLTIVDKALAREPADRYPSAKELADDLRRFQTGQIVSAHRYSTRQRIARFIRRRRAPLSVAAIALVVLAVAGIVSVNNIIEASKVAAAKQAQAEKAEQKAAQRADDLTIVQARASMEHDPTQSIEWLASLSPAYPEMQRVRFLAADAQQRGIGRVLRGHQSLVNALAFAPDKALIASVSDDHTLRTWDVGQHESRVFSGHFDEVWRVAFSSDGKLVATSGKDKTVRVWNAESGAVLAIAEYGDTVNDLVFSPDGRSLAAFDKNGSGRLFNVDTGTPRELVGAKTSVADLRFSPSGDRVVAAHSGTTVTIWDSSTGKERESLVFPQKFYRIAITPDTKRAICVVQSGELYVWDFENNQKRLLGSPRQPIEAIDISPNGRYFATAGLDGGALLWNIETGTTIELPGLQDRANKMVFSPDGFSVAAASTDHRLWMWDVATLESRVFSGFEDSISGIAFSNDGEYLTASSRDRTVRVFSLKMGIPRVVARHAGAPHKLVLSPDQRSLFLPKINGNAQILNLIDQTKTELSGLEGAVTDAAFSPEGDRLATTSKDGTARIWDLTGHEIWAFQHSTGTPMLRLAYAPNGRYIAASAEKGALLIADADSGQAKWIDSANTSIDSITFSADGSEVITGHGDGTLRLVDTITGAQRYFRGHEASVQCITFMPDGNTLVTGSGDHTVRLWDMKGSTSLVIRVGGTGIEDIAVSPDGALLAVLGGDSAIHLIQTKDGAEQKTLRGHGSKITRVRFSSGGRRLVSASQDHTARLWHLVLSESRPLLGNTAPVTDVLLTADGKAILTFDQKGTVRWFNDDLPEDPSALRAWLKSFLQ